MENDNQIAVYGRDGKLGWMNARELSSHAKKEGVVIHLENGSTIQAADELLVRQDDGSYYLPISRDQIAAGQTGQQEQLMVIPVIVEEPVVTKKTTDRRVLIHKKVNTRDEVVDEPGFQEHVSVERVPINKVVEQAPEIRYEGDTMIIPVLEEQVVVEKRLILKEEVRITREQETIHQPQRVTLNAEEVLVERLDPQEGNK